MTDKAPSLALPWPSTLRFNQLAPLPDPFLSAWLIWLQIYPQPLPASDRGMPTGRRETNMAILFCFFKLCPCFDTQIGIETSSLEGFSDLLSPPGRFAPIGPRLAGIRPVAPWHVETCRTRWRGERRCSSSGWVMMGRTWGKEASTVGSHVIWRSTLEHSVEEVL